jgi:hypothetical protein
MGLFGHIEPLLQVGHKNIPCLQWTVREKKKEKERYDKGRNPAGQPGLALYHGNRGS